MIVDCGGKNSWTVTPSQWVSWILYNAFLYNIFFVFFVYMFSSVFFVSQWVSWIPYNALLCNTFFVFFVYMFRHLQTTFFSRGSRWVRIPYNASHFVFFSFLCFSMGEGNIYVMQHIHFFSFFLFSSVSIAS